MDFVQSIGIGAVSGFFMAGAGFLKSYNGNTPEDFKPEKFVATVVLGAVVGGIASGTGLAPDIIIALPAYAGAEMFLENLIKSVLRFRTQKLP